MIDCAYPQHRQANTYHGGNSGVGHGHPNFCGQRLFFAAQTMRFFVLSRNASKIRKLHIWSEFSLNAGTRQNANRGVMMETLGSTTRSLQTTDLNLPRTCWVNVCLLRRPQCPMELDASVIRVGIRSWMIAGPQLQQRWSQLGVDECPDHRCD